MRTHTHEVQNSSDIDVFALLELVNVCIQSPTGHDRHLPFPHGINLPTLEFSTTTNYTGDNAIHFDLTEPSKVLALLVLVYFLCSSSPLGRSCIRGNSSGSLLKPYESPLELIVPFIFPFYLCEVSGRCEDGVRWCTCFSMASFV